MSINDQIKQIETLRDKAVASCERTSALAEKHRKEADDFNIAIEVLYKIAPSTIIATSTATPSNKFAGGGMPSSMPGGHASPIYQRILNLLRSSQQLWWTANQIQETLKVRGDVIKMTSISPNLSRLKENGDIVRDELKVALAVRVTQNAETPEDDLLLSKSPGASNDHDVTSRGTQPSDFAKPSSLVKPWAGGGT